MAEKEDRRVKMTKRLLKESLLELLKTQSIHKVTIRALCNKADINRSTFYKYYGSQYELLEEMEQDWMQQIERSVRSSMHAGEIPFVDILRYVEENIELSQLLVNSNVDPDFAHKLFDLPSIKRLIHHSLPVNEGGYAAEYFHACYVNGGYSLIKHWINKENRESPEEMTRIMSLVLAGRDKMPTWNSSAGAP